MAKKYMGSRSVGDHTVLVYVDFKSRGKEPDLSLERYLREKQRRDGPGARARGL